MKKLSIALKNCRGIRELQTCIDFRKSRSAAIYAPNGTMKTSFARTFRDLAARSETRDNVFPNQPTERSVVDENNSDPDPSDVVVILSYDEELGPTESTSTLLVNSTLRKEYKALQVDLLRTRAQLTAQRST